MRKITSIINNQQGSLIVMAMIVLVLLTVIGISASTTSTTEVLISTNAVLHNIAFYTAESGIEVGRAALNNLKIADVGSWDNLLFNIDADAGTEKSIKKSDPVDCAPAATCDCTPDPCYTLNDIIDQTPGGRTVGPATFTLTIADNDDLDDNVEVDSDDTIFLTSTLVTPYRNATATISTLVHGGGVAYSQEHYDSGSSGEASLESDQASTTVRW